MNAERPAPCAFEKIHRCPAASIDSVGFSWASACFFVEQDARPREGPGLMVEVGDHLQHVAVRRRASRRRRRMSFSPRAHKWRSGDAAADTWPCRRSTCRRTRPWSAGSCTRCRGSRHPRPGERVRLPEPAWRVAAAARADSADQNHYAANESQAVFLKTGRPGTVQAVFVLATGGEGNQ